MLKPADFFDLTKFEFRDIFKNVEYAWDALKGLEGYVQKRLKPGIYGSIMDGAIVSDNVYIGKGTIVEPGAFISGPAIIGDNSIVRHGAYIRENVIAGNGVILGHCCEFKNSILFNESNVPHFAYVGNSILGWRTHLGAGVKVSNIKLTQEPIVINIKGRRYKTGLVKFGAVIGDEAEIGCDSILNPGSLIGKRSRLYTNISWRGYCPPDSIVKLRQEHEIVKKERIK